MVTGFLGIGTENDLFFRPARITLININVPIPRKSDNTTTQLVVSPYGQKLLAVYETGQLEAHGAGRNPTWTHLSGTVSKGGTTIIVADAVNWQVGDEIIITTTDYSPYMTERRIISAISGKTITLNTPLSFSHYGEIENYYGFNVDMRAEGKQYD